jgi:hypothetical protein
MIQGTFNPSDLTSATWTHMRPRRFIGLVGLVIVVLFFWALWWDFSRGGRDDQGWQVYVGLGILVYFVLTFGAWLPYRIRRTFRQRKDLHRECSFVGTAEGLRFASDGIDGIKPWSDYLKWREGRTVLLLYISDGQYQLIPKRFFEPCEDLSMFRSLLLSKLGKPS